jgi:hypothetical protein
MNRTFFILFLATIISSCIPNKNEELIVAAKWNFNLSGNRGCEDDKSNSPSSCIFVYKGKRYGRTKSYKLDSFGKIDSIFSYHMPLGVNIYSIEQYEQLMVIDTLGFKELKKNQITWNNKTKEISENNQIIKHPLIEDNNVIISNGDTLVIYELAEK